MTWLWVQTEAESRANIWLLKSIEAHWWHWLLVAQRWWFCCCLFILCCCSHCVCVCFVSGLFSSVLWLRNNLAEKEMADYVVLALMWLSVFCVHSLGCHRLVCVCCIYWSGLLAFCYFAFFIGFSSWCHSLVIFCDCSIPGHFHKKICLYCRKRKKSAF